MSLNLQNPNSKDPLSKYAKKAVTFVFFSNQIPNFLKNASKF